MKKVSLNHGNCPICGYLFDTASRVSGDGSPMPTPDDFTLCIQCGTICKFGPDLKVVLITDDELLDIPQSLRHKLLLASKIIKSGELKK